jgi:SAM-dependent methyltransferase
VLDIGCGVGWYSIQYAKANAHVFAIDISSKTINIAKKIIEHLGLKINLSQGNAENIEYPDEYFDLIISNGVLHHTPNCKAAINETFRVLKPGGIAKLTFYRKGILHNPLCWPILRTIMYLLKVKHPGSDLALCSKNVDDFIRQYDGSSNPVGIGKKNMDWVKILEETGYNIKKIENHYFPKRFMPFNKYIPEFGHRILDKYFGTMVYFSLVK